MTTTSESAWAEVAPPRDYGSGDTWADDGDYYVPPELRPFYATAEPTDAERRGYVQSGCSVSEEREQEVTRLVSPGSVFDPEPVTTTETRTVNQLVDLNGASGYTKWLHIKRLEIAQRAHRLADFQAAVAAHHDWCQVCERHDGTVRTDRARYAGSELIIRGCPAHLPVLAEAARAELIAHVANGTLQDGRRVGDVAADVVSAALRGDEEDGAA